MEEKKITVTEEQKISWKKTTEKLYWRLKVLAEYLENLK